VNALGNTEALLQYGWRIPFLTSIVLVAARLYVRLQIEETPVFRAAEDQQPANTPLREAFTKAPQDILLAAGPLTMMFALSTPERPISPTTAAAPPALH
jgi:hypothetical protein